MELKWIHISEHTPSWNHHCPRQPKSAPTLLKTAEK
jgi:hypothetical protein